MSDADCTPGREPRSLAASYNFSPQCIVFVTVYHATALHCMPVWMVFQCDLIPIIKFMSVRLLFNVSCFMQSETWTMLNC